MTTPMNPPEGPHFRIPHELSGTLPHSEVEPRRMIRPADIERWKRDVDLLGDPVQNFDGWTTAFVGAVLSFVGTIVGIYATDAQPKGDLVQLLVIATISSALMAAFCFVKNRGEKKRHQKDAQRICDDMTSISHDPSSIPPRGAGVGASP